MLRCKKSVIIALLLLAIGAFVGAGEVTEPNSSIDVEMRDASPLAEPHVSPATFAPSNSSPAQLKSEKDQFRGLLKSFPDELNLQILKHVTTSDLNSASCVNTNLRRVARDPLLKEDVLTSTLRSLGGIKRISLKGATFQMGPEDGKKYWVKVDPLKVAETKLTREQWKEIMGSEPEGLGVEFARGDTVKQKALKIEKLNKWKACPTCPVTDVSWYDAQHLVAKLKSLGICARLPTEAEQEYYMRIGFGKGEEAKKVQDTALPFGALPVLDHAWVWDNSSDGVKPVGTNKAAANSEGVQEPLGTAFEWSQNQWSPLEVLDASGKPILNDKDHPYDNPLGPGPENLDPRALRVFRGCCWSHVAEDCRSARRV